MSPDEGRRLTEALESLCDATAVIGKQTRELIELARASILDADSEEETDDVGREDWQAFLTEHPELEPANPVDLTEGDVLKALEQALQDRYARGAVRACDVAKVLFGPLGRPNDPLRRSRVSQVARRLSNLAHAGLIVRLRHRSAAHTSNFWTLPGRDVSHYVRQGWIVPEVGDDA